MSKSTHKKEQGKALRVINEPLQPPLPSAHFRVVIDRKEIGLLSISPLQWFTDGAASSELRQSVVLRRAASQDRFLYQWYCAAIKHKSVHRDVCVVQLGCADGDAVNIWRLEQAVPVRWTGPEFDALSNGFAMEELEVRYASITWLDSL